MKNFRYILFLLVCILAFSCTKQEADLFMPKSKDLCGYYFVCQQTDNQISSWSFKKEDYMEMTISNTSDNNENIIVNLEDFSYLVHFQDNKFAQKDVQVLNIKDGFVQSIEPYKVEFLSGEVFKDKVAKSFNNQSFTTDSIYFEILEGENHYYYHGYRKSGF